MTRQCKYCILPKPVAKMIRHSVEKEAFLTTNRIMRDKTHTLPPLHSELFLYGLRKVLYYSQLWQGKKGDHKHKIMGRSVKPMYCTVLQVFLQMVVALRHKQQTWFLLVFTSPENFEIWGRNPRNRCVDIFSLRKKTWMPHVTCFPPY